jgi:predicted nucleotidyltransferase
MGTYMLDVLFSKIRKKILVLFFTHPDTEYHLREVARCIQGGRGAVARELNALAEVGILVREERANLVIYSANHDCPVYDEIHNLIVKTAGVADVLLSALSNLEDVSYAFIFGSSASGNLDGLSDIDVFVIGDIDFTEVSRVLFPAEKTLSRDISPVVYSEEEYANKLLEHNHFVMNVLEKPIIMLIGDEDELRAMGSEQSG